VLDSLSFCETLLVIFTLPCYLGLPADDVSAVTIANQAFRFVVVLPGLEDFGGHFILALNV